MLMHFVENVTRFVVSVIGLMFAVKAADIGWRERNTAWIGLAVAAIFAGMFAIGGPSFFKMLYCMGAELFSAPCN